MASAGVRFLQIASAFLYMPFLISGFGLRSYGVFVLASSFSIYLGLLDFGVNPTIVKRVAEYVALDKRSELSRLISSACAYYAAIGVLAALLLGTFATWGVDILALEPTESLLAQQLFRVSAVVALFVWPLSTGAAVLNGLHRYDLSSIVGAAVVIANLVAVAIVLLLGYGPIELFVAMGVIAIVSGATTSWMASRLLRGTRLSARLVDRASLKAVLSFSWMLFVFQLAVVISDQQTDRFILGAFVGAASIGLYEAAAKLNTLVAQLASLPSVALIPASSKFEAKGQLHTLRSLYLRGSKYTVLLVAPVAVTLLVVAEPLLVQWLGLEFAELSTAARIFLLTYLMYANLMAAYPIFIGRGQVRFVMWHMLATAVLNISLSLLLVRDFGVLGVIVGTVAADTIMFPLGLWYALRTLHIRLTEYAQTVMVRSYALLLVPAAVAVAMHTLDITGSLLGVIATIVASVGIYWVAAYLLVLQRHEKDDLRAFVSRFRASEQE